MEKIENATFVSLLLVLVSIVSAFTQNKPDIIDIRAKDLDIKSVRPGNYSYLVYTKKTKESGAENLSLVNIKIETKQHNGKPVIAISQSWEDAETPFHRAYTLLSATDGSTLFHQTFSKQVGIDMKFDFETRKITMEGEPADTIKPRFEQFKAFVEADFQKSFNSYNLNWHSDLIVFQMFPYKQNRRFRVNFYDPGSVGPQIAEYVVTGSDKIRDSSGENIDCWTMEYRSEKFKSVQKFWISKKTREVLKEEDSFNGSYRFKLKLKTTEVNSPETKMISVSRQPPNQQVFPAEIATYFSGEWSGKGEFATGKQIEADVTFGLSLDGSWLQYSHKDRPPNGYYATGSWSLDHERRSLVMKLKDNSGASRTFSSDGWKEGRIVFVSDGSSATPSIRERFIFERTGDNTFKMIYESSRDGQIWKLGDFIVFERSDPKR